MAGKFLTTVLVSVAFLAGVGVGVFVVGGLGGPSSTAATGTQSTPEPQTGTPTQGTAGGGGQTPIPTAGGDSGAVATGTPRPASSRLATLNETRIEREIHQRINALRSTNALRPLDLDRDVRAFAREHSDDMARETYVAHYAPDGQTKESRLREADLLGQCQVIDNSGEFFFTGPETLSFVNVTSSIARVQNEPGIAQAIVRRWQSDRQNRRAILLENAERHGVGVAIDPESGIYVTQNICG
jgi:uncharacterized protein YkwD